VTGRTIALPFFNNLNEEQIDYVVEKLKEGIKISRWSLVFSEEKIKKVARLFNCPIYQLTD